MFAQRRPGLSPSVMTFLFALAVLSVPLVCHRQGRSLPTPDGLAERMLSEFPQARRLSSIPNVAYLTLHADDTASDLEGLPRCTAAQNRPAPTGRRGRGQRASCFGHLAFSIP
jgi:hypothetical protein